MTALPQGQPMGEGESPPPDGARQRYARRSGEPTPAERVRLAQLGVILRSRREVMGLTLADLEPIAGARGSIGEIERGTMRTRPSRIRALCGVLGLDADVLLVVFADVIAPERPEGPSWHPVTRPPAPPAPVPSAPSPAPLPNHLRAALASELWGLRVRAGLGRKELARAVGRSRPWVSIAEHGLRAVDREHLEAWLVAVDVTFVDRLLLALRFPGWVAPPKKPTPSRAGRGRRAALRSPPPGVEAPR